MAFYGDRAAVVPLRFVGAIKNMKAMLHDVRTSVGRAGRPGWRSVTADPTARRPRPGAAPEAAGARGTAAARPRGRGGRARPLRRRRPGPGPTGGRQRSCGVARRCGRLTRPARPARPSASPSSRARQAPGQALHRRRPQARHREGRAVPLRARRVPRRRASSSPSSPGWSGYRDRCIIRGRPRALVPRPTASRSSASRTPSPPTWTTPARPARAARGGRGRGARPRSTTRSCARSCCRCSRRSRPAGSCSTSRASSSSPTGASASPRPPPGSSSGCPTSSPTPPAGTRPPAAPPTPPSPTSAAPRCGCGSASSSPARSPGDQLKAWLGGIPGLDPCTLRTNQEIYVGRPVFAGGLADPMPVRSGVLEGLEDVVQVPDDLPEPRGAGVAAGRGRRRRAGRPKGSACSTARPSRTRWTGSTAPPAACATGSARAAWIYAMQVGPAAVDVAALAARLAEVGRRHRATDEVEGYRLEPLVRHKLRQAAERKAEEERRAAEGAEIFAAMRRGAAADGGAAGRRASASHRPSCPTSARSSRTGTRPWPGCTRTSRPPSRGPAAAARCGGS